MIENYAPYGQAVTEEVYKYPPEGYEEALSTVISQCETWVYND